MTYCWEVHKLRAWKCAISVSVRSLFFFKVSCLCCFIRKIKRFLNKNIIRLHGEVVISWKSHIICLDHSKMLTGLSQCLGWKWNTCKRRIRILLLFWRSHLGTTIRSCWKKGNRGQNWRGQDMGQHSTGAGWRETQNNLCSVSKSSVQGKSHRVDEWNSLGSLRSLRCVEFLECAMKVSKIYLFLLGFIFCNEHQKFRTTATATTLRQHHNNITTT